MAPKKKLDIKDILKRDPDDILKDIQSINMEEFMQEEQKLREQFRQAEQTARQAEKDRIDKMKCPFCKSKLKKHFVQTKSNGVIGRGFHSHVVNEYYICLDCGIHYSDLNKPNG